jgi:hypothetical protein
LHLKQVETFIEKKVRKSIEFDFVTFYQLKFLKLQRMGQRKSAKQKKNSSKKGGINLGKKERNQIKKLVKILEGWMKEDKKKEKQKALEEAREKKEMEPAKEEKDDQEDKEDEVDDQESSSSESYLDSDEDSDATAAGQHPSFIFTF